MHKKHKNEPSQRQLRVGEQLRQLLAECLQREHFRDPDLQNPSLITVTSVDVSPDLKNATAYVIPLGGVDADKVVPALNRASGFFRSELARKIQLRYIPRFRFELDTSFDNAQKIETLLRQKDDQ